MVKFIETLRKKYYYQDLPTKENFGNLGEILGLSVFNFDFMGILTFLVLQYILKIQGKKFLKVVLLKIEILWDITPVSL